MLLLEPAALIEGEGDRLEGVVHGLDGLVFGVVEGALGFARGREVREGFGARIRDVLRLRGAAIPKPSRATHLIEEPGGRHRGEHGMQRHLSRRQGCLSRGIRAELRNLRRVEDVVDRRTVGVHPEIEARDGQPVAIQREGNAFRRCRRWFNERLLQDGDDQGRRHRPPHAASVWAQCRWQMAMARASAASGESGCCSSFRRRITMNWTCSLAARP